MLALAPGAAAETIRFEAETGRSAAGRTVRDRGASGHRAVLLMRRGSVRARLSLPSLTRVRVRARGRPCRGWPRVAVAIDGRRVASLRVRSRRWRRYSRRLSIAAGTHTVALGLRNPRRGRRCSRRLLLDSVALVGRPPTPASASAVPTPAPATAYQNPVYDQSFPDPGVLQDGDAYYAYATGNLFPVLRSTDLVHWTSVGTAMSSRPAWATSQGDWHPWAPSVVKHGGQYVLFYVALNTDLDPDTNCVGVATSTSPTGPFDDQGPLDTAVATTDQSDRPIGCGDDAGYSNIDPASFVDTGGTAYLYLSTGHRCDTPQPHGSCLHAPAIAVIPLTSDLLHAAGPRQALFSGSQAWEFSGSVGTVENPWLLRNGSTYDLLYSGGEYKYRYGMGYATSSSPTGPFAKSAGNPILTDVPGVVSAGGGTPVTGPHRGDWLVYHGRAGAFPEPRTLRIDPLRRLDGGGLAVDGPTTGPQTAVP